PVRRRNVHRQLRPAPPPTPAKELVVCPILRNTPAACLRHSPSAAPRQFLPAFAQPEPDRLALPPSAARCAACPDTRRPDISERDTGRTRRTSRSQPALPRGTVPRRSPGPAALTGFLRPPPTRSLRRCCNHDSSVPDKHPDNTWCRPLPGPAGRGHAT